MLTKNITTTLHSTGAPIRHTFLGENTSERLVNGPTEVYFPEYGTFAITLLGFETNENYHEFFDYKHRDPHVVPQDLVRERGRTWVKGVVSTQEMVEDAYGVRSAPGTLPYFHRNRMNVYGNYGLVMKLEFFFFYVPVLITLGFILPVFTVAFAVDEPVYTTTTVKVTGRQWYWVYEIESPPEDEDEE